LSAAVFHKKGATDLARGRFTEVLSKKSTRKAEFLFILILVLLSLTLFFFHLGTRPLWDIDEGKHAATSKDMILSGDWITPTLNGETFFDKPILFNWLVAISFLVFGFTEFAARFPAAVLGLGCIIITYLLGRKIVGPTVGLLSGAILATNGEYIILSRAVVHDISLVFFMTLALFFFYLGFKDGRNRKVYFLLFYASTGFAVLAKGPVGVLLPALIIGLFLILERKLGFIKEMRIGWGILIFLGISAPWYLLISLKNRDYAGYFFIQQNLMNFISLSQEVRHPRPVYFYVYILLGGFFPWSLFLPLAIIRAFREGLKGISDGTLFLLVWFGVIFLFFSMASSKLEPYILPLFPAVSLLVGLLWHDLLKGPTPELQKGFLYSFIPILGILILGMFYLWMYPPLRLESQYGIDVFRLSRHALWIIGGTAVSFYLFLKKNAKASFSTMVGMVGSVILFIILVILPLVNPYRSTKGLAQKLDLMVPPGEKLVFYRYLRESALFYTNRRALLLIVPQQLRDYLASEKRVFCVIDRRSFERLGRTEKIAYVIDQEGGKLIISNKKSL